MYRTKNKISYLFAFLDPSAASPFPFFPLLGETQKGSRNDPGNQVDFAHVYPFLPISKGESEGVP